MRSSDEELLSSSEEQDPNQESDPILDAIKVRIRADEVRSHELQAEGEKFRLFAIRQIEQAIKNKPVPEPKKGEGK